MEHEEEQHDAPVAETPAVEQGTEEHHDVVSLVPMGEELTEVIAAPDPHGPGDAHHEAASPMDVSGEMFLWTLGTFTVVAVLLTKYAWRPILDGLDKREHTIRTSVEDAKKVAAEMAGIEEVRTRRIAEADAKAGEIVSRARQAGIEAERVIKEKAQKEAGILVENAEREIDAATEKAAAALRKESVEAAVTLAEKILHQNLDAEKQRLLNAPLISRL